MSAPSVGDGPRWSRWRSTTYWLRRGVLLELWGYLSILRFVLRRPKVPAGAAAFTYHQPLLPLLIVFIVVSAIELVVVDLLVRRWPSVRIAMLALGIWGLVWMFGLLSGFLTRPHAVGPDGIRVRSGAEIDLSLPWDQIESVMRRRQVVQDKQPLVAVDEHDRRTLHLRVQLETAVEIRLRAPVTVRLPRGADAVAEVRLFADDPQAFVEAADRYGGRQRPRSTGSQRRRS